MSFYQLINHYKTPELAIEALQAGQVKTKAASRPPSLELIDAEIDRARELGLDILLWTDDDYPTALKAISDAPPLLYLRGDRTLLQKPMVAIVGSRNASLNGMNMAHSMAQTLGEGGWVVVSGLARQIDAAAHRGALNTGTIGVVGGGADVVYPPENAKLFNSMAESGLIISEFPPSSEPVASNFPRRNRLIAGLSAAVVVVEATLKSGSLITARLASEYGRMVMALPGFPSDPRAAGPNMLIKRGACLVENGQDILNELPKAEAWPNNVPNPPQALREDSELQFYDDEIEWQPSHHTAASPLDPAAVLSLLGHHPTDVDDLASQLNCPLSQLIALLSELEINNKIQRISGNQVVRIDTNQETAA